jgi:acetyltransferase
MQHPLSALFEPRSIAVFGASERPGSVGAQLVDNLLGGGYAGELHFINPSHSRVRDRPCVDRLERVAAQVDLAVVATPAPTVLEVLRDCAATGVRAMVVLTAGFAETGAQGVALQRRLVDEARRAGIRLLGPNCLGLVSSKAKMNATFASMTVRPGSLALVSQSGALCSAILDWAEDMPFGFSNVISVGDAADVGFGDLLDYLAMDASTRAILVYVEGVSRARSFVSGLRAAARFKPTVVLKAGRHPSAARAAHSHTGSIVGADDVFDAVLRRAGAVRVDSIGQLFATAELLGAGHRARGNQLAVVTNAGGPGVMAADHASDVGLELAELSSVTLGKLRDALPQHWSGSNPIDLLGDAGPERYRDALRACLDDDAVHGALVMLTPQAMTHPTDCARAVAESVKDQAKPVVACWMGGKQVASGREVLRANGVPVFNTPEASIDAFRHLWAYHRNQRLLLEAVSPMTYVAHHDAAGARLIIEGALKAGDEQLGSVRSKAILSAFGIPCSTPILARTADEALIAAENLGFPVALKIAASDISHKTDVGGVRLGIDSGEQVRVAFSDLLDQTKRAKPDAHVLGVTVEPMHRGQHAREIMVGVLRDPCFGPAISVGTGGVLVELLRDKAVGLPPLNPFIAHDMIERTQLARLLGPFRGQPAVDPRPIAEILSRVSDIVSELPEIVELDINPLLASAEGVLAVDARIVIARANLGARPYDHMAIHPYPASLVRRDQLADGTPIVIRPIRPEDAQIEQAFVRGLSDESRYFRFMQEITELTPEMLTRFTQLDYDREMAFIAIVTTNEGEREIGVSRYVMQPDGTSAEFALVVADEWHEHGVGTRLMQALFDAARARGLATLDGEILRSNGPMLHLVTSLGFATNEREGDVNAVRVTKVL